MAHAFMMLRVTCSMLQELRVLIKKMCFQTNWLSYFTEFVFAYHIVIQVVLPALVAERVNIQMDGVILLLNEHLRTQTGNKKIVLITFFKQNI